VSRTPLACGDEELERLAVAVRPGVAVDLARNPDAGASGMVAIVPSAFDNMSPHPHSIRTLAEIPVASSVTVNSIVAAEGDGPVEQVGWKERRTA
jgi:hypothetical protein